MMRLRKKLLSLLGIIGIIIILAIAVTSLLSKPAPTIEIHNKTTKTIYIYTLQSYFLIEPTLEELQQLKNVKFIKPNYQLSVPVSTSYTDDSELSIGWKISFRTDTDGGGIRILINDSKGVCGIDVFIKEHSAEIIEKQTTNCAKKIKVFQKRISSQVINYDYQ